MRKPKKVVAIKTALEKSLGADLATFLDDSEWKRDPSKIVPTGIFELDEILFQGFGGLLLGGRYELYGPKGSCKSTLAYRFMANVQKVDPRACAIIDTEVAHRPSVIADHARAQGADPDRIVILRPDNLDHAYRVMVALADSGEVSMIIWDSYGATLPRPSDPSALRKYHKKDFSGAGKFQIAEGARTNVAGVAEVRDAVFRSDVLWLVINQARLLLGGYGQPKLISSGGNAFHHNFDVRIQVVKRSKIIEDGRIVGVQVRVLVEDSRFFRAGAQTGERAGFCPDINVYYDGRVQDPTESIINEAIKAGIITQSGSYFVWGGERYKGRASLIEAVSEHRDDLWTAVKMAAESRVHGSNEERDEYDRIMLGIDGEDEVDL